MLQQKNNPNEWTPFTWDDYKSFCTHNVRDKEKGVLNSFVNGGKPVWNTTTHIKSGWLSFDGERYSFTDKMIQMLGEKYPV